MTSVAERIAALNSKKKTEDVSTVKTGKWQKPGPDANIASVVSPQGTKPTPVWLNRGNSSNNIVAPRSYPPGTKPLSPRTSPLTSPATSPSTTPNLPTVMDIVGTLRGSNLGVGKTTTVKEVVKDDVKTTNMPEVPKSDDKQKTVKEQVPKPEPVKLVPEVAKLEPVKLVQEVPKPEPVKFVPEPTTAIENTPKDTEQVKILDKESNKISETLANLEKTTQEKQPESLTQEEKPIETVNVSVVQEVVTAFEVQLPRIGSLVAVEADTGALSQDAPIAVAEIEATETNDVEEDIVVFIDDLPSPPPPVPPVVPPSRRSLVDDQKTMDEIDKAGNQQLTSHRSVRFGPGDEVKVEEFDYDDLQYKDDEPPTPRTGDDDETRPRRRSSIGAKVVSILKRASRTTKKAEPEDASRNMNGVSWG